MVPVNTREIIRYAIPVTLTLIGITSFINLDILLVKHFFSAHDAGLYAGLSLVGKVVFYISAPIGTVMFPLIVLKHSRKENFTNIFKLSVLLVIIPSLLLTGLYAFFPKFFILFFLKNKDYLSVSSLLALFGIFTTLYSLLSILATFYLSIKKTTIYIPIIIGALLQIVLITLFHQTFLQIILISLIIVLLLVIGLLLYYPHAAKKKFTN